MQNPYNFEACTPPRLTMAELQKESERRTLLRQLRLLRIAGALMSLALVAFAILILPENRLVSMIVTVFAALGLLGAGAVSVVFSFRGGALLQPEERSV